ncbi:MAG TPA: DUF1080 domain-containing protein [Ktedonobacteraceae bacterium]|nr:DUF1080 domain-containing protein [Ktedonobacteraceae bacterium]
MRVSEGKAQQQHPRPQKNPRTRYLISAVVLLSVIIGSSFFFLIRSGGSASAPKGHHATPTATPTPAIPTPTPPPQALFFDTFADNSHGWNVTSNANNTGYVRIIVDNRLILSDTNPKTTLIESLPTTKDFDDFTLSADFTIDKASAGDSIGVYVRGDSNLDHDYRVDLNSDNTFDIAKEYLDSKQQSQSVFLDGPNSSPAIHPPGQKNTMTLMLKGSTLVLFINGANVSTVTDTDYATGQIALFVHTSPTSDGVTASFTRVEVDPAPDQLP